MKRTLVMLALVVAPFGAVAVEPRHSRRAGPAWASHTLNEVRVLDADCKVVRVLAGRAELEEFAAWFQRADEVAPRSGRGWTHKLDIKASGGGRWLYDASSGEFRSLSVKAATPVYRLQQADRARFSAMLAAGPQPIRRENGEPTKGR